ncbi:unnamed protein product [Didymodactylos carnosus]|uniref:SRR1-like domain-containing protein n=1 Tax=Didymodactylos carnosus TaxID=1234261 RepID=A0A813PV63_9BILA|nr:unnamed protein product [Didymodactylos carnosus]CAF0760698.1 unnamed protein product [Didymodactylos carnosus]CAF3504425.1 unnamed protein product [Didymodactylos carnosus]CAF3541530.1 unnamed protein product [Didymodactylos carnosus]
MISNNNNHRDDDDEFRFAKKHTRRFPSHISKTLNTSIDNSTFDCDVLTKNLYLKIDSILTSYFWLEMKSYIINWLNLQQSNVFDIVCYGLGHISSSVSSQYQYCLLKLISQIFVDQVKTIFIYDPIWTTGEIDYLKSNISCQILNENDEACYQIVRSTLFFIPFCGKPLHNNILWSNWSQNCLRQILIFGNSLNMFQQGLHFDINKFFYIYYSTCFCTEYSLPQFDIFPIAFNQQVFVSFEQRKILPQLNGIKQIKTSRRNKTSSIHKQLEFTSIELVPNDIWIHNEKPFYTEEDEIIKGN